MKSNNIILFVIFLFSICTKSFGKITFIEKGFTFETLKGDSLVRIKSFKSDTIVEELHIPATITHNREKYKVYILGRESLANHSEILSVMVDEGVSDIGDNAFENCINLKSLYLPASISSVGICLFGSCYNLRSIVIDSNNEDYDSREGCNAIINSNTNELVAGCVATVIPSSVKSIASFAFYHCNTMEELTIPEGVESIGDFSFGSCTSLKNIILPLSLKKIEWNAFNACTSLKKIFIPRNVSFIGK